MQVIFHPFTSNHSCSLKLSKSKAERGFPEVEKRENKINFQKGLDSQSYYVAVVKYIFIFDLNSYSGSIYLYEAASLSLKSELIFLPYYSLLRIVVGMFSVTTMEDRS